MTQRLAALSLLLVGFACQRQEPLPVLADAPPFSLTAQDGSPFSLDDLQGRVWIADFVFTNCPGPCPMLTSHMADVQRRLAERNLDVHLVSFSVDPETDTPPVLTEYGKAFGADFKRWTFLTGDKQAIYDLIQHGFLLAVSDGAVSPGEPNPAPGIITHTTRFALVDQQGRVRAYYFGTENETAEHIVADAERLLDEG